MSDSPIILQFSHHKHHGEVSIESLSVRMLNTSVIRYDIIVIPIIIVVVVVVVVIYCTHYCRRIKHIFIQKKHSRF